MVELQEQPFAGWRAESLFQSDGHLGRDTGMGIQQVTKGLSIDTQNSGGISDTQPVPLDTILPDGRSRMHHLSIRDRFVRRRL
jgi:hypothetical protein